MYVLKIYRFKKITEDAFLIIAGGVFLSLGATMEIARFLHVGAADLGTVSNLARPSVNCFCNSKILFFFWNGTNISHNSVSVEHLATLGKLNHASSFRGGGVIMSAKNAFVGSYHGTEIDKRVGCVSYALPPPHLKKVRKKKNPDFFLR